MCSSDCGSPPTAYGCVEQAQIQRDRMVYLQGRARLIGDRLTVAHDARHSLSRPVTDRIFLETRHMISALLVEYGQAASSALEFARRVEVSQADNLRLMTQACDAQARAVSLWPFPSWRGHTLREIIVHMLVLTVGRLSARFAEWLEPTRKVKV